MALLALVSHRQLEHPVDIDRVLRMILVHDLVEAEVGDIPSFESSPRKLAKAALEQQAISRIRDMLDPISGAEIFELFQEYELCASPEVQIQHNLADLIASSASFARR